MKHCINFSHCVRELFIMFEINNENFKVSSFGGKNNIHTEKCTHNNYTAQWTVTVEVQGYNQHSNDDRNPPTFQQTTLWPLQLITPHPPPPVTILLIHDIIVYIRLILEIYKIAIKLLLLLLMFLRFIHVFGF